MPAYQSLPEFDLSEKYHLKAACCEKCAEHASDQTTAQEWQELATQWHSMADQAAAQMSKKLRRMNLSKRRTVSIYFAKMTNIEQRVRNPEVQ